MTQSANDVLLLGGILLDRNFEVDAYPPRGQDTLIRRFYDRPGGSALNAAVTLHNLGRRPFVASRLGEDEVGDRIARYVAALGLPTDCLARLAGEQTGYCLNIIDPDGERTFFTYKGCEKGFAPEMVPPAVRGGLAFVYVTGYYLFSRQAARAVLDLVRGLKQNGVQVVFDPGPLAGEIDPAQLQEMIALSDWALPNSAELEIIRRALGFAGDPVKWLLGQGVRSVALKQGAQGVRLYGPGIERFIPGLTVRTVDSTGAGDSFAGGLISGLIQFDNDPVRAVELGNACGAYTATQAGPHSVFTPEQLDRFITASKGHSV